MQNRFIILGICLVIGLAGCTVPKKLSRTNGYFDIKNPSGQALSDSLMTEGSFDGHLNLIYEKKIKGAPLSPMYIGNGYVGYQTTRGRFVFYRISDGKRACRIKKGKGYILNPIVTDSLIALVKKIPLGQIRIRNFYSGKTIQDRRVNQIRSGPILCNKHLIFGSIRGVQSLTFPDLTDDWETTLDAMVDISPVTDGKTIYFAAGNGLIGALDAETGEILWQRKFDAGFVSELGLGRRLYVGLADGALLALDANDGTVIWRRQFSLPVHGKANEYGNAVFVGGTDEKVYCLAIESGETIWEYATGGIVTAEPIIYGEAVLIGSHDRYLYSLNRHTGELIDRELLEGPVNTAAAVNDGRIFIACRKNRLYCFEGNE